MQQINSMEKSLWDRIQEVKDSINGGVEPMDEVRLLTRTVKIALGIFLIQSIVIALWWSIKDGAFWPWLIPTSSFLQVGWFWNKVTDSWKAARGYTYQHLEDSRALTPDHPQQYYQPPTINIQNEPITGHKAQSILVELDMDHARESVIEIDAEE